LGCIAPGVIGKPDVSIWIFIDVSGSIDRKAFENIINHANKLRESTKASVWITNFDATIQDTFVLDQYNYKEILKTKLSHTQGGTMFAPIFDKLRSEKKFKPDVTLIFTDGYCFDDYDMPKNLRMMWVMTEDHKKQPNGPHLIMKEYF
jgi:predicted metal-dependent peptidase